MLITGITTCTHCGKSIPWYYQTAEKNSNTLYDVETPPEDKTGLANKPYLLENNCYIMSVWCPHCEYLTNFEYKSNRELH